MASQDFEPESHRFRPGPPIGGFPVSTYSFALALPFAGGGYFRLLRVVSWGGLRRWRRTPGLVYLPPGSSTPSSQGTRPGDASSAHYVNLVVLGSGSRRLLDELILPIAEVSNVTAILVAEEPERRANSGSATDRRC